MHFFSRANIDALTSDITQLSDKVNSLHTQLGKAGCADLEAQFSDFLTFAEREVAMIREDIKEIDNMRVELAEYFAEDTKTFKLEECFSIMRLVTEHVNFSVAKFSECETQSLVTSYFLESTHYRIKSC